MNAYRRHTCAKALTFALVVFGFGSAHAEEIELTHCYSGTAAPFHQSKDSPPLWSWNQNGIIMSAGPKKMLHNAVVRCEGVQIGGGATRDGHGYCKIVDDDGDAILAYIPLTGLDYAVKFVHGTGSLQSTRFVRSPDGNSAMPGTYQGCRLEKGQLEVPK